MVFFHNYDLMSLLLLLLFIMLTHQEMPKDQPVRMELSENGANYTDEVCENITFKSKDIIFIPKQLSASQCNCALSMDNDTLMMYIYLFLADQHSPIAKLKKKGKVQDSAIFHNLTQWYHEGRFNKSLKIDIQPMEQSQTTFYDDRITLRSLPIRIVIRHGYLKLTCTKNESYDASQFLIETTTAVQTTSKTMDSNYNTTQMNFTGNINITDHEEEKQHVITTLHRPSHNNTIIIGVICVLVFIIVFAGSMILVSLIMHRKRLAVRLAIHLRNIEEANNNPEGVPLSGSPLREISDESSKNVKLIGVHKLNGIVRKENSGDINIGVGSKNQDYVLLSSGDEDDSCVLLKSPNNNKCDSSDEQSSRRITDKKDCDSDQGYQTAINGHPHKHESGLNGTACKIACDDTTNKHGDKKKKILGDHIKSSLKSGNSNNKQSKEDKSLDNQANKKGRKNSKT